MSARYSILPAAAIGDLGAGRISALDLSVLAQLGTYLGQGAAGYASQSEIAKVLRKSRQTVNKSLQRLAGRGYVTITPQYCKKTKARKINLYQVNLDEVTILAARKAYAAAQKSSEVDDDFSCENDDDLGQNFPAPLSTRGDTPCQLGATPPVAPRVDNTIIPQTPTGLNNAGARRRATSLVVESKTTKIGLPNDWELTPTDIVSAEIVGMSKNEYKAECRAFIAKHRENATLSADWSATWSKHCEVWRERRAKSKANDKRQHTTKAKRRKGCDGDWLGVKAAPRQTRTQRVEALDITGDGAGYWRNILASFTQCDGQKLRLMSGSQAQLMGETLIIRPPDRVAYQALVPIYRRLESVWRGISKNPNAQLKIETEK